MLYKVLLVLEHLKTKRVAAIIYIGTSVAYSVLFYSFFYRFLEGLALDRDMLKLELGLFCVPCSIREMCGTEDVDISYRHFKAFYELFTAIDKLTVDS